MREIICSGIHVIVFFRLSSALNILYGPQSTDTFMHNERNTILIEFRGWLSGAFIYTFAVPASSEATCGRRWEYYIHIRNMLPGNYSTGSLPVK